MTARQTIVGLSLLCATAAGCSARAQTVTPANLPGLDAPPPPARVVVPAPERPTMPVAVEEPAPPAGTATPPAGRGRDTSPPPSRPAPPPATPPEPPAAAAPPVLLTTAANTAEFEKRVRAQVQRAQMDLAQVNPRTLGTEARAQYDSALGFIRQAEEALKVKNLVYAGQLADKAATMAALLKKTTAS